MGGKKRFITIGVLSLLILFFSQGVVFAKENESGILWYFLKLFQKPSTLEVVEKVPIEVKPPKHIRGIYITADTMSTGRGEQLINTMIENGGNAVVIDIEHGGGLLAFNPKNEYLKSINPGRSTLNELPQVIEELHKKGVYVIARQVIFNDPYTSSKKPEWRIKYKHGGGTYNYKWLDPSKPGVQNYNLYIMQEVADLGFDEIQFDYIRFPTANFNYLDFYFDEDKFSRSDVINDFLSKAKRIADNHNVKLSVDVFGAIVFGGVDWKIVGQDAAEMAKYVDAIYPMTYPSHVSPGYYGHNNPYGDPYSFIYDSIDRFVKKVDGNAEIRTWVQGFPLKVNFGTWFVEDQIKGTYDANGNGFVIWSPGNHYTYSWPTLDMIPEIKEEMATEDGSGTVTAE